LIAVGLIFSETPASISGANGTASELFGKLEEAIRTNNVTEVERILAQDSSVIRETSSEYGYSALHTAAISSSIGGDSSAIVQLLISSGANVTHTDKSNITPLHLAAFFDRTETVRLLINNGADVYAKSLDGQTPLHAASPISLKYSAAYHTYRPFVGWPFCQTETVDTLLKAAGEINATDYIMSADGLKYTSSFHWAAETGCTELVKLFLKAIPVERNRDLFRYVRIILQ
jgi:ankyrin repeat protein